MTKHVATFEVTVITDGKTCDVDCPFAVYNEEANESECRLFDCALPTGKRAAKCLELFKDEKQ